VGVKLTVAEVPVTPEKVRLLTSLHTGGGVVLKVAVAAVEVALAAQLATTLTV
jgi:hypothetical protein